MNQLLFNVGSVIAMPCKPMKPCAHPGCPRLTHGRYCDAHQKQADREYDKYLRDPESRNRYSGAWKKIRAMKLSRDPLCEMCSREGRYTRASLVHHIQPLAEGGSNAFSNLMSLCDSCHGRLHAERGDRWHNKNTAPVAENAGERK